MYINISCETAVDVLLIHRTCMLFVRRGPSYYQCLKYGIKGQTTSTYTYCYCKNINCDTALQAGRFRVRFHTVSLEFFIYLLLSVTLWPWSRHSASNRYEYQECLQVGKGGRCVGLTILPPSCADCHEIWEPEPPGTLRTFRGL
jgi:hypothetical protein